MSNTLLVADCPRCGSDKMTFEVNAHVFRSQEYGWKNWHEVFAICRNCRKPTIFLINLTLAGREDAPRQSEAISKTPNLIMEHKGALNNIFEVERYIGLRDNVTSTPPEHLPADIMAAYKEGAACYAIGCYNAAATMFRLCLDFASKPLLPEPTNNSVKQPTKHERFNLGARLAWLFDNGLLPVTLKDLASCIREDANDGAHAGTLSKAEADDVIDFTTVLLERLYTEPKKLELAEQRRQQRRQQKP